MSEKFFKIAEKSEWLKEKRELFHIPFITLQGSRACFPRKSFDSSTDYDVRFLYSKDAHSYFRYGVGRNRDTLEHKEELVINGQTISVEYVGWDIGKFIELGVKSNPYCHAFIEDIPQHWEGYTQSCYEINSTLRTFVHHYNCSGTLMKGYLGQMMSTDLKARHEEEDGIPDLNRYRKLIYNGLICFSRLEMVKQAYGSLAPQFNLPINLDFPVSSDSIKELCIRVLLDRKSVGEEDLRKVLKWIQDFLYIENMSDYSTYLTHASMDKTLADEYFVKLVKLFTQCHEIRF